MNRSRHIVVIGAGPGGLTCAMLLAHHGYRVSIFEKEQVIGGRSAAITAGPYTFDTGPTFLMMTSVLREMFGMTGRKLDDYCTIKPLDPMYKLSFKEFDFFPTANREKMKAEMQRVFPDSVNRLDTFYKREGVRYSRMYPCLKRPYGTLASLFNPDLMRALPSLSLGRSLYGVLGDYFRSERNRICFTFQAKYLGMSPWECPAAFAIIPFIEHSMGIDHVQGGLSRICDAMARVATEEMAELHLGTLVKKIVVENSRATGVELASGDVVRADAVVINADFGYAMTALFDPGIIRKWSARRLQKKKFSCSTFMLYLGLDKLYNEPHHHIMFAGDYHANINDIVKHNRLSEDMSVYVRNASITDPLLAPAGHSAVYVLVPVPNTRSALRWDDSMVKEYRDKVLGVIEQRTSMKDIRNHIRQEVIITPRDWQSQYNLYAGATFNLGHTISQMLYFRPHNEFEEVRNCYLAGGGTHPGSGLPTIYESARISYELIQKRLPLQE
jgi:phytoene desaturase